MTMVYQTCFSTTVRNITYESQNRCDYCTYIYTYTDFAIEIWGSYRRLTESVANLCSFHKMFNLLLSLLAVDDNFVRTMSEYWFQTNNMAPASTFWFRKWNSLGMIPHQSILKWKFMKILIFVFLHKSKLQYVWFCLAAYTCCTWLPW